MIQLVGFVFAVFTFMNINETHLLGKLLWMSEKKERRKRRREREKKERKEKGRRKRGKLWTKERP